MKDGVQYPVEGNLVWLKIGRETKIYKWIRMKFDTKGKVQKLETTEGIFVFATATCFEG